VVGKRSHKGDTMEFHQLDFSDQARSITAMINNLAAAIRHHVRDEEATNQTRGKCLRQVERLLDRLRGHL
jgi:hypothetical protein